MNGEMWRLTAFVFSLWFVGLFAFCGLLAVPIGSVVNVPLERSIVDRHEDIVRPVTVMVMVAAKQIPSGQRIEEEDLYAIEIPPHYLPEGVFLSLDHVVSRVTAEVVLANEMIRADRLTP